MTIHYLLHKEIDKLRWDVAVRSGSNGLMYAWSIYLDAICPGWSALVNDDYSLVMPLTHRKKFGIGYLYQPPFSQQLGVFGTAQITEAIVGEFISECQKHYAFAEIFVNSNNVFSISSGMAFCKNYTLSLSKSYEAIRANYTTDLLKKNLQRTVKFNLQYGRSGDVENTINTFQQLYADRTPQVLSKDYEALINLAKQLLTTSNAFIRQVTLPNGELLACGLFLKDEHRIYNIASSTLPNGRTFEANHFLFDQLIQEFAATGLLLDFEGSDLAGIERFYKKFGAVNEPYFFLKWNNLPWPVKLLKK